MQKLSRGLYIGGDLNLLGCVRLTALPDELLVCGSLHMWGCESFNKGGRFLNECQKYSVRW